MGMQEHLNNEKELLCQVATGNQQAFAMLVDKYSARTYSHVLTYIKNAQLSEEITQDIFLQLWKHRAELPAIGNFQGYLHIITRNRTISELRKKLDIPSNADVSDAEEDLLNPVQQLEYRQLSDILLRGIDLLPPRRKQVFRMSRFEGMSYEMIATELGISKGTVNEHMVEALLFLRSYLRSQMGTVVTLSLLIGWLPEKF
jgi:RNA polymerase sigma-70 factor (ECF subfamily)